jgi:cytochrome c
MQRGIVAAALVALALLWSGGLIVAQQTGSAAEAKAMFDRAISALKANESAALSAFNDKNNKEYRDRDLYVFCYSMSDGKFTAHPNPALMGTDVRDLKIKDDPLGQRAFDGVKNSPEGSVSTFDYLFPKPGSTEPVPKQSFETRIGNQGCGVGYYK